ncbi:hypothetical protein A3B35_03920 [Candidatus Kaiserbacteria bacterium RIFCSPLOWO2_01_FULL_54_24]|uniref:Prepilin peptidase n=1 Tax=Candidatus Kaiserbacteria bacterium RIFCSPLOWO2_01_FULL_54_24 TaxID=1798515 RepID=A0A1F6ESN7_9BACT|nr:MAG: hypothetical protein A3B35_03920 [Candidatus Kaiserbacteria bacterium RIFCSPLOWO2_01_FULL_54_24]
MFIAIIFGAFGLIVGSFLNVLIVRWGTRSLTGRSACMSCGRTIPWYDLVPIFSWILLGGRCRLCGSRISLQYPLVESGTGLLFFIIGLAPLPLYAHLLALPIAAVLFAIAVYDLKYTLIPDAWVWTFNGLTLFLIFAFPLQATGSMLPAFLAGPVVAAPLFAFWFFSKGAWMGFGDVKLALGMGWLLGIGDGLFALFFAFILGALVSVPLLFFSSPLWQKIVEGFTRTPMVSLPLFFRKLQQYVSRSVSDENSAFIPSGGKKTKTPLVFGFTMKSEIPFGPFLIAATLIVWISNMNGFAPINLLL